MTVRRDTSRAARVVPPQAPARIRARARFIITLALPRAAARANFPINVRTLAPRHSARSLRRILAIRLSRESVRASTPTVFPPGAAASPGAGRFQSGVGRGACPSTRGKSILTGEKGTSGIYVTNQILPLPRPSVFRFAPRPSCSESVS